MTSCGPWPRSPTTTVRLAARPRPPTSDPRLPSASGLRSLTGQNRTGSLHPGPSPERDGQSGASHVRMPVLMCILGKLHSRDQRGCGGSRKFNECDTRHLLSESGEIGRRWQQLHRTHREFAILPIDRCAPRVHRYTHSESSAVFFSSTRKSGCCANKRSDSWLTHVRSIRPAVQPCFVARGTILPDRQPRKPVAAVPCSIKETSSLGEMP